MLTEIVVDVASAFLAFFVVVFSSETTTHVFAEEFARFFRVYGASARYWTKFRVKIPIRNYSERPVFSFDPRYFPCTSNARHDLE